ncbi:NADH-quinone oxidoreductase subunit C [bacterium]|nr:NADH-quinone oxidoreductase subunit C [bacterium]
MNKKLIDEIITTFKNTKCQMIENKRLIINTKKDIIHPLLKYLKDKEFTRLALISCVDWINDNEFEIIYILTSYLLEHEKSEINVIVKTRIARDKPQIKSIIPIFENAEFYEREICEMFGVHFEGHPRLISLFLEIKYDIPPFRKDFILREFCENTFDKIPPVGDEK